MNAQEYLDQYWIELEKLHWFLDNEGCIRARIGDDTEQIVCEVCPVTAPVDRPAIQWMLAAAELDIDEYEAVLIACAADNEPDHQINLRTRLLTLVK